MAPTTSCDGQPTRAIFFNPFQGLAMCSRNWTHNELQYTIFKGKHHVNIIIYYCTQANNQLRHIEFRDNYLRSRASLSNQYLTTLKFQILTMKVMWRSNLLLNLRLYRQKEDRSLQIERKTY
ncbi:uncharacterized protein KY384_002899 [Bacidia gigantensis]|uniref:uncharacterized protein n=1 Tax=Bacidia gigantensis TaxID=2732470 RepID=UPI001D0540E1|nr:uncharacterized protein KY384_002899 [Bacidia gigantensis]KAG8532414.1 hypothetical protein KY384_002899 [Bacidia gigantensis]